jgi:autotransporter-associated beta strand protein
MSLNTWLRQLATSSRKTIRHGRRPHSIKGRLQIFLELLENRLAPATLHWIGSATGTTTELPGVVGEYWQNYGDATSIVISTDPTWIGQSALPATGPDVIALTDSTTDPTNHPSVLTFPRIDDTSGFLPYADFSATDKGAQHTVARWGGQIFIATAGNVSFQTASIAGSVIYIDGNLVVNNNQYPLYGDTGYAQGTIHLGAGYHQFDEEYYFGKAGNGEASLATNWDPKGGSAFVPITNAVFFHQATGGNWSDPGSWKEGAAPKSGDTVVFDPMTTGFVSQALVPLGAGTSTGGGYFSNDDIPGLTLNGIVINNATTTPFIITGNAVSINNTDTSLTNGITDTTPGTTTTLSFTSITNGGSMTITNGSAISQVPTLQITSPIDLNGNSLKEASSATGTSDTGLTLLSGVISSSVPTTDSIVQNGGGVLALSGTNTFDGAVNVTAGVLTDAGNQSLGALTGAGTTVSSGAGLGLSGGDNAAYAKGVTLNGGASITAVDGTSPTASFPLTLTGDALIQSDGIDSGPFQVNSSLTFNGPVNIGNHTLTLNINNNNGNAFRFNGPITATTGAQVVKNGNQRASFMASSPNFGDGTAGSVTITVNAGRLADGALDALGTGNNTVTINSGGTLTFRNSVDHTETQTVTIAGPGADTGSGPIGAISSDDGSSTLEGSWVIKVASGSDETIGTNGGFLTLGEAITLSGDNLILQGTSGTLTLNGVITGAASSAIIKNGGNTATITYNNKASFTGPTTVNGGLLDVFTGSLGGGTAPIMVKGGGLGLNAADLGTTPLVLGSNGLDGSGAIENLSGTSHIGGTVTISSSTTFGSDAGTLTVDKDIAGGKNILTFTGAGNMVFNGAISGDAISHSAGLLETQSDSEFDTSSYNPPPIGTDTAPPGNPAYGSDIQLYPFMAETSGNDNSLIAVTNHRWGTSDTWIYTGTINFPNDPKTPGSGTLTFAKSIDDYTLLRIDGVTYINDTNWQNALNTGGITLAAGPHIFDLRLANGGGGAGAIYNNQVTSAGWTGWGPSIGFIYRVDSGTTDPMANSKNVSDYVIPTDPGNGSLFQVDFPNVLTKSGKGTVTFNGNNTYQEATLITGGTLVGGSSNALGATAKLTVQSGGALALPAAGGMSLPATLPISIAGSGPTGAGAIESLGGSNTINGKITLASAAAIGSDAGTLTLGGVVHIDAGVITYTGAGNINVTGSMTNLVPGLLEGQVAIGNDPTDPINPAFGTDIQLGTTMAQKPRDVYYNPGFPTTMHQWTSTDTWIYTGTVFWPSDPKTPGSGTLSFAKDTDDVMFLRIDGTPYISNTRWDDPVGTGPITLASGPHSFEARFGNGNGGAGADGQNNNGWTGWTDSIGFIYRVDSGAGTSDPLSYSTNVSDYKLVVDPGDGSLFQTLVPSGVTKSGSGTVTLAPVNNYAGPTTINSGKLVIKDEATLGAGGASNNTSLVTINGGALETTSSFATTLNYAVNGATSGIMVDPGQTITQDTVLSGSGTLNKLGTGTLVLTGANTYPGGTVISAGAVTANTVLSLGTGPVTMAGGTLSLQSPANVQQTIATTGYTQDVIWASPTEPQPVEGTTSAYDTPAPAEIFYPIYEFYYVPPDTVLPAILYQAGAVGSPSGTGLPAGGQIVSKSNPAVSFQLQPYTAANDLLLQNSGSGTLTLTNPGKFASLNVLDVSTNGTATYNVTLNFSDGSSDQIGTGATAPNRGASGNSATGFNGQVQRSENTITYNGATGALWEQDFTLPAADQAKTLTSVTFKEENSGPNLSIFALSGVGIFASPTFDNNVTVTADSTIDDPSQSTAVGALTLKGGTLSITGTSTTLTTGAVNVTGNAGLNVATGETLTLGAVSNTGTNTLTVNGAGTTNLANVPSGLTLGGTGTVGTAVAVAGGGAVNPGTGAGGTGTLTTTAGIALASGSTDNVDIGGTAASSYDQISSGGIINLNSDSGTGATLKIALANGFSPTKGQTFTIIKNTGSNPTSGTFAGLPEGASFSAAGTDFTISYVGGSGHDVVLTANPPGAVTHLSVTPSVTKANAGDVVTFTVAALDANNIINGSYAGTVKFTSSDAAAILPANATLPSGGVGTFDVTFQTSGQQTLTATDTATSSITGTSPDVSIGASAAGGVSYFKVSAPAGMETTGTPFAVTVTAVNASGATFPGYSGKVHFTSSDAAAVLPADASLTAGVGVFNVTLTTSGSQTITATDNAGTLPSITGTTSAITTRGLVVTALTPTATGFTVTFSKPFTVADVNLYAGSQASPLQDVTLVGAASGPVNGSFIVDPSGTSATFKASSVFLSTFFQSTVLPDDTWTATLVSGTGTGTAIHGFLDVLNVPLDGGNNAGHDNYTTSFTTANSSKEALGIPDFARGPDGANTIKVPNDSAKGIPVTLSNVPTAAGVTDAVFTLTYNPTLLTPTGGGTGDSSGKGSTFTMSTPASVDATHSTVAFTWHNPAAQSGTVVLGDIVANVPDSAANEYKVKEILGLSQIKVNNADFTGVWANSLQVNAYFGDVTGDGKVSGLDIATAGAVANGSSLGLTAYKLVDPAVVGDIAGDGSMDATAVSDLASFTSNLPTPPMPSIPTNLTITPGGPDPTLNLASGNGIVSVLLDHPHPVGSTGMEEAVLALTYDPKVLTVSSSDITLGSIPGLGSGWHLVSVVDQATGQIGIDLYSTTAISATKGGSLVYIAFHVVPGAAVPATAVQLVSSVTPNGRYFSTEVADDQGQYVLSPGMDHLVVETGLSPVSLAAPAGEAKALLTRNTHDQLLFDPLAKCVEETAQSSFLPPGPEAIETYTQEFQIGSLPLLNALLLLNSPRQLASDQLFLALARGDDPVSDAQDDFWNTSVSHGGGQSGASSDSGLVSATKSDEQQAPDHMAMDKVFAEMD